MLDEENHIILQIHPVTFDIQMTQISLFLILIGLLKIHGDDPVPSKVPGGSIVEISSEQLVKVNTGKYGSTLWDIKANTTYNSDGLPRVLNLTSDPYEAGFDTGLMLAEEYYKTFTGLVKSLFGEEWWEPLASRLFCKFIDAQYEFLGAELGDQYKEEFRGLSDGGKEAGYSEASRRTSAKSPAAGK